jgi:hypothetical protein
VQSLSDCVAHPFFQDPNIIVYQNTMYTWFLADLAFSLYSGAIFEAVYFGASGFLPMKEGDGIYPLIYLNLLSYQKIETLNIEDQIKQFLLSYQKTDAGAGLSRIHSRFSVLK